MNLTNLDICLTSYKKNISYIIAEKINIVVSLILICFILVILSIEKSKRIVENFYNEHESNNNTSE